LVPTASTISGHIRERWRGEDTCKLAGFKGYSPHMPMQPHASSRGGSQARSATIVGTFFLRLATAEVPRRRRRREEDHKSGVCRADPAFSNNGRTVNTKAAAISSGKDGYIKAFGGWGTTLEASPFKCRLAGMWSRRDWTCMPSEESMPCESSGRGSVATSSGGFTCS
jgi:hypothetical protein